MNTALSLLDITRAKYPAEKTVAVYQSKPVRYQQFLTDISTLTKSINSHQKQHWALYTEEAYPFAVGLVALLLCNKQVMIPGNNTEATLHTLKKYVDGFMGDMPNADLLIPVNNPINSATHSPATLANLHHRAEEITIFTSGSTGEPKPIKKSLLQFEHEINALEQCWGASINSAEVIATVSHQHIYGLLFCILWPLASGRIFHSERALDSALAIKEAIDTSHGAIWIASPAHLKRLHENLPWPEARKKLKRIFSSGGPLSSDAAQQLKTWHGHSATEVYGSSETGGIAWREQLSAFAHWQPLPNVQVKTDADSRLLINSPHIDPGNWYATDDAATLFDDGSFALQGRLDRIVKLEEKRLSLVELEQTIIQTPWVKEVFCILLAPEKNLRETLATVIVLNDTGIEIVNTAGKNALVKQIKDILAAHFELSLLPRKWRFVEHIPVNEQAKINHTAIKGLFTHNE
jgi:acyl-coenzyme A synthetase/AMP-(fatty) acid ligase